LGMHTGRGFPVCVCFLCLHFDATCCGWWVWVRFRVGHLNEASMLSGSRSTPVGR